jgi:tetratricopeptide (TPR) repeat protein
MASFFDQWFDKICEPDFIIGIPFQTEGGWKCAMRNLGDGEAVIQAAAVTEKGERLVEPVQLRSQGIAEVFFKTADKIASVEIDPEKLYPQTNYDNDARPPYPSPFTLFKDANADFSKKAYGQAESKLREALSREPEDAVARALLVRTLAGQNRFDEAKKEIENIRKSPLLPIYAITWINYTLGEIALASKQSDAADYFGKAVAASKEVVPARQKRIEAERVAGKTSAADESVRAFIDRLDKAIREATNQALDPLVVRANLNKFVRGLVVNKPEAWSTQILHAEMLTADKVSLDVAISAISGDKQEQRGTAVYVLRRSQSGWVLNDIELFNVQ